MLCLAPLQPTQGALTGALGIVILRRILHTLVESHRNIAAQIGLDAHGLFRTHKNLMSVDVRGKCDPFLSNVAQSSQGKHLESSAVREHRAIPSHEAVQPTHSLYHVIPRTQVQVIRIGQLHLTADLPEVMGRYSSFDGPLGAHIHEHWSLNHAMGAGERSPSGFLLRFYHLKHPLLSPLQCLIPALKLRLFLWR